ncbi:hypothetical protein Slin15195_G018300 [Septoria linicola]|uniref:Xylanolytic transcriptional activator regulatory domain-containing protein n=1 Tax=Septoria linicola TaxID=215465 RepID=A0A9Q9EE85_9PEZI|nr:hypothetical protein Slin15195_G018300 [Septoria linicola]
MPDVPIEPLGSLPDFDVFDSDVFNNFDSFISTMGLNVPFELDLFAGGLDNEPTPAPPGRKENLMLHRHPNNAPHLHGSYQCLDVARGTKKLEFADADADELDELRPMPCPWGFSTAQRDELNRVSALHGDNDETFRSPSRLALGRYIAAYFDEFHNHFPILHASTFRPQTGCAHGPELVLTLAACGAAYFAIINFQSRALQATSELREILQAYARGGQIVITESPENEWQAWILAESHRRTLCCTYIVLNLCSTALDVPPSLLVSELDVKLPSSTAEWTASSASAWSQARKYAAPAIPVQQALASLFSSSAPQHSHSSLANLILMNALLQRIYLSRQMQLESAQGPLRDADANELQNALSRWTLAWQQARGSMLDPRNPDGSNSFTSTSSLGLAYIRLSTNYASRRHLASWDANKIAQSLYDSPLPQRTSRLAPALLHATQGLYIPVKLGLDWVSRSEFLHWDLSIFLYYLEAAVFTSKWLSSVAVSLHTTPMTDCEMNILKTLHRIVDDVDESLDPMPDTQHSAPAVTRGDTANLASGLAVRIADTWARLFRHHNSPWPMVDLIGKSLDIYAGLLRNDLAGNVKGAQ